MPDLNSGSTHTPNQLPRKLKQVGLWAGGGEERGKEGPAPRSQDTHIKGQLAER